MRRVAFILGLLIVLALVGVGATFVWGYAQYVRPGPIQSNVVVVVPQGTGLVGIAEELERKGVITDALVFVYGARIERKDKALRAGEFLFRAHISPRDVVDLLVNGETVVRRLTIPEGLTTAQILARLETVEGLEGKIERWPGEGMLLPETYHFSYDASREAMVERMAKAMQKTLHELWVHRRPDIPIKSMREALILASIVEKETALAEERGRVAAVFVNRLRKGMKLQSDPTVAYGLAVGTKPLGRALTRADLKSDTPFNTYVIKGLPPGPICNPGRAALEAVLNPGETKEYYFVADGSGGHVFARTLKEHNTNVAKWRKIERQRRANAKPAN